MTDKTPNPDPVTDEEIEAHRGEALPDRQAMSIITPGVERPVPLDADIATIAPEDGTPESQ